MNAVTCAKQFNIQMMMTPILILTLAFTPTGDDPQHTEQRCSNASMTAYHGKRSWLSLMLKCVLHQLGPQYFWLKSPRRFFNPGKPNYVEVSMFIGNLQSKFAISGWTQWMTSFGVMAARLLLQFEALARGDTCYKNTGGG